MSDGNLRKIFQDHIPKAHWQPVETWSTGQGVPDTNACINGVEFWIENKLTSGWAVTFEFGQVGWAERRIRAGGRVFLAVRRLATAGKRRIAADELWLFHGSQSRDVSLRGLQGSKPLGVWSFGPAQWTWDQVIWHLTH